jgi:hypothetical protein
VCATWVVRVLGGAVVLPTPMKTHPEGVIADAQQERRRALKAALFLEGCRAVVVVPALGSDDIKKAQKLKECNDFSKSFYKPPAPPSPSPPNNNPLHAAMDGVLGARTRGGALSDEEKAVRAVLENANDAWNETVGSGVEAAFQAGAATRKKVVEDGVAEAKAECARLLANAKNEVAKGAGGRTKEHPPAFPPARARGVLEPRRRGLALVLGHCCRALVPRVQLEGEHVRPVPSAAGPPVGAVKSRLRRPDISP